ncbi:MAG: DNRLRE domain-containing protein [Ignavibacteria bacterium]|nr:DNRLRE domain-containing protein [Ignavibacteria bacterium]
MTIAMHSQRSEVSISMRFFQRLPLSRKILLGIVGCMTCPEFKIITDQKGEVIISKKEKSGGVFSVARSIVIGALLLAASTGRTAQAQTQDSLGASRDNTLYEDATGALGNGVGAHLFAGRTTLLGQIRRGLLAFDIAGNIMGATIDSVKLTLHMSRTNLIAGPQTVELHRVLAEWGQGTSDAPFQEGAGAPSTPGDATCIHTVFNTTFWTNAGGDFSATISASLSVGDTAFYTWGSTAQMVADVQDWLENPMNNFGWLPLGNESTNTTTKRFDTRDNSSASLRPVLVVNYTGPLGIEVDFRLPTEFALHRNYPNPFNPSTTIQFSITESGIVRLAVHNLLGQQVAALIDKRLAAGTHDVVWNASNATSGVYFYRLEFNGATRVRRMILLR